MPHDLTMEPTCEMEIKSFKSSGITGLTRLKQVLPSIFSYYNVVTIEAMQETLRRCSLVPILEDHYVTFYLDVSPENPFPTTLLMRPQQLVMEAVMQPPPSLPLAQQDPPTPPQAVEP